MRSNLDACLSQTGGICEVSVDASEDVLLDLERAHEETGAVRWVMLRKVLADFRRQLTDVYSGIADARHQVAVLDEKLLREKSSREAGVSATQADLKSLAQRFSEESNHARKDGQLALEGAVLNLRKEVDDSMCQLQTKIAEDVASLRDELHSEREARCTAIDTILKDVSCVRSAIEQEADFRTTSLKLIADEVEVLKSSMQNERQERSDLKERLEMQHAEVGVRCTEEQSQREQVVHSLRHFITEIADTQKEQTQKHSDDMGMLAKQIKDVTEASHASLLSYQASLEERLVALASIEGKMHISLQQEAQTREARLSVVAESVEALDVIIKRQESGRVEAESALHKTIEGVAQRAEDGRRKLEEDFAQFRVVEHAALAERIRDEERIRVVETDKINVFCKSLHDALEHTSKSFQAALVANSVENDKRREDNIGEMKCLHITYAEDQRKWVNDIIEQQRKTTQVANEALILEARACGEERGREAAERIRSDLMAEVARIETSTTELVKAQEEARKSSLAQQEVHAHKTAHDLKECLTSHNEFMEVLANEQKLLIKRLNEGFASEGKHREDLTVRAHRLESDMQKVKEHLPILFVPSGFPHR